jgi:NAD(P)-dependent dehydrogenase (short-subunit alcohol dehydrogenase family)
MSDRAPLAVVSGASSGIGHATAQALAGRGFHVLAGIRSEQDASGLAGERVECVRLDITDAADIERLRERVEHDPLGRRLRALVNNAGIAVNAPVEAIPVDEWRHQFDVNLFGHVAITQALLPALLEASGRIVNVSSIGGRVVGPTFGAYAASKFALEAMSDALRREVSRLGVQVIVVEPGGVATPIWTKGVGAADRLIAAMDASQVARYEELIAAVRKQAGATAEGGAHPSEIASVIADSIVAARPRTRYVIGRDARMMARIAWLLPDRVLDGLIARRLGLGSTGTQS